ncbi:MULTISPECIES: DegT/DnrJ/EryC1/StrS aminotransferase family protein [Paenibacillus]|uniref:DegT/DnrJ/EryC1/StrS family aminotransferase n=1 Tax=Paenibacillus baimaensis TaxID=2982185 RepID=A0ABT2UHV2_9BACL|nr:MULTISPECIES: DegT/DnrJ/EryC1/StrS family aminotransferase [unclassified Paenibacillus]MCU6794223.1 DegT/DnrJ/EryC1/StrS family aminotransferase [Paenibacillus sp. WQ 127069]OMF13562.1 UDP-4-amino-4,6-dideoxy-N-acetyl-beta-L-altrosamine transaminase [Paenibacillus sp. FSL H7-0331]
MNNLTSTQGAATVGIQLRIPYALPLIDEREIQEVIHSLKSNWLSRGPKTLEFEESFAASVGSPLAIGLNSCTAGLHLALLAYGVGPGDEVITTPYTFVATVNTIIHCGATPVFVDIDPVTMNLNPDLLEQAVTSRTKVVIPVHFAGLPCEMDQILQIAERYQLKIIEDAAHAVHTKYKERMIGSIGDVTCFSFYATKNLTTGEGGMVTTRDEEIADRIRMLSLHGMDKNAWNRYTEKGSWYYEVQQPGFKYNMTDIQAALGLVQLSKLSYMQDLRELYAAMYTSAFSSNEALILPADLPGHRHAWHLYVIRLQEDMLSISRSEMIELLKEAGIGTSVHFIPVPQHPYYRRLGFSVDDYPETKKAYEAAISLPLYPGMTIEEVNYVSYHVNRIVDAHKR